VISVEQVGHRFGGGAPQAPISVSGATRPVRQFGRSARACDLDARLHRIFDVVEPLTVAFVLERVLGQCAEYLEGRPVPISELAQMADRLHRPVSRAVEYLAGADDDPIEITAALVKSRPAKPL
jgi:hypothetical protein